VYWENSYLINTVQKKKPSNKNALDENKILTSNKSIVKPSVLNQPNIKAVKQQKKAIWDKRRREITNDENNIDIPNDNLIHEESRNNNYAIQTTVNVEQQSNTSNRNNNIQNNNLNTTPDKIKQEINEER